MKFTDKKYLHLKDVDDNKIYKVNFQPYQIGFDDSYDDIELILTVNSDNTIDLSFDADTFNISMSNIPVKEQDDMLKMFKKQLLNYPYFDKYELKFEKL